MTEEQKARIVDMARGAVVCLMNAQWADENKKHADAAEARRYAARYSREAFRIAQGAAK